jgi:hypothetical protein
MQVAVDYFNTSPRPTRCKSYRDVEDTINRLCAAAAAKHSGVNIMPQIDLIWLADQIRMRFQVEPVAIDINGSGTGEWPRIVIGTGYVPLAIIGYGRYKTRTRGVSEPKFHILSPGIKNTKGAANITRSDTAKGLLSRIKKEAFEQDSSWLHNYYGPNTYAYSLRHLVPKADPDYPSDFGYFSHDYTLEMLQLFSGETNEPSHDLKNELKAKFAQAKKAQDAAYRNNYVRRCFSEGAVSISQLPYFAEYRYMMQEFEVVDGNPTVASERVYFNDFEELSDRYPHIVATNNLVRMEGKESILDYPQGFNNTYNYLRSIRSFPVIDAILHHVLLPRNRIMSEDERRQPAISTVPPVGNDDSLSVLNF